jgi:hypothetical protein
MATFNDIPFEVFTTAILPHLGIRPVCVLAQVNTLWKDFADDPIVWKHLYLQNTPANILDTSVHIGPKTLRQRNHTQEYKVFRETGIVSPHIFFEGKPFTYESTKRCRDSEWFLNSTWCCSCMPQELKSTIKSWREVRTDGINTDDFPLVEVRLGNYRDTGDYCAYVNSKWEEYNSKHGLSTHNLCQNPDHYDISTLGALEDCKKKKSFKKHTLKILEKERKAKLSKATREKKSKLKRLEKARRVMEQLEREYLEAEKVEGIETKNFNNISQSVKLA